MSFDDTGTTEFMPQLPESRFIDDEGKTYSTLYTPGHQTASDYSNLRAIKGGQSRPIYTDDEGWPLAIFDSYGDFLAPGIKYRAAVDGTVLRYDNSGSPVSAVFRSQKPTQVTPTPPTPQKPAQQQYPQQERQEEPPKTSFVPWLFAIIGVLALIAVVLGVMLFSNSSDSEGSSAVTPTQQQQQQNEPDTITETVTETETETVTKTPRPETTTVTETETETPDTVTETVTEPAPAPEQSPSEPSDMLDDLLGR